MSEQSKKDKIEPRKLHSDQELLEIFLKHQIEHTKYGGKPMYHYSFDREKFLGNLDDLKKERDIALKDFDIARAIILDKRINELLKERGIYETL